MRSPISLIGEHMFASGPDGKMDWDVHVGVPKALTCIGWVSGLTDARLDRVEDLTCIVRATAESDARLGRFRPPAPEHLHSNQVTPRFAPGPDGKRPPTRAYTRARIAIPRFYLGGS